MKKILLSLTMAGTMALLPGGAVRAEGDSRLNAVSEHGLLIDGKRLLPAIYSDPDEAR